MKLYDHKRVTPAGMALGAEMARLTEHEVVKLAAMDEPDDRCKTCAFRAGTVPNGCAQTQMDALKCFIERVPFFCHMRTNKVCHGWFAAVQATKGGEFDNLKAPWEFSEPDETETRP